MRPISGISSRPFTAESYEVHVDLMPNMDYESGEDSDSDQSLIKPVLNVSPKKRSNRVIEEDKGDHNVSSLRDSRVSILPDEPEEVNAVEYLEE